MQNINIYNDKCRTTIPKGSRAQAIGARNAGHPKMDDDIVSSVWQHAAAFKGG